MKNNEAFFLDLTFYRHGHHEENVREGKRESCGRGARGLLDLFICLGGGREVMGMETERRRSDRPTFPPALSKEEEEGQEKEKRKKEKNCVMDDFPKYLLPYPTNGSTITIDLLSPSFTFSLSFFSLGSRQPLSTGLTYEQSATALFHALFKRRNGPRFLFVFDVTPAPPLDIRTIRSSGFDNGQPHTDTHTNTMNAAGSGIGCRPISTEGRLVSFFLLLDRSFSNRKVFFFPVIFLLIFLPPSSSRILSRTSLIVDS
ncbi:hypothetical protein LX36DRAFT_237078 [Colletotrichum falcatum]|nr:hypothetical protein LX36DRAFT_237078 [Colletotrichum falcatum]